MKKSFSLKASDENERTNCRNDFFAQYCNTAANEWKKEKKKKKNTINADEKSAKMNMKKLIKNRFKKKKENFWYIMFENLVVKNLNVRTFAKHYINDTTSSSNIIENFSFKFKNISERESNV